MILVTGSAGFIGSNFVLDWLACTMARGHAECTYFGAQQKMREWGGFDGCVV